MTTKFYSTKSNAKRAASEQLGDIAGIHFEQTEQGWTWAADDSATDVAKDDEDAPAATTAAHEAEPAATVHVVENVHLVNGEPCPLCGRTYRAPKPRREPREPRAPREPGQPREGSKEAMVIEMLRRPEGTTIVEIAEATGWQHHTIRGFFAAALKKRHGLQVTSEKPEKDQPRIYRIAA